MKRFRSPAAPIAGDISNLLAVGELIDAAMQPGNFFVDRELNLHWITASSETIPWEIFRGRLLPRNQTREQKTLLSWQISEPDATEPTISVKLDPSARAIHVTRGFKAYVWEAIGDGVIESRETVAWIRELVGTILLTEFTDLESLQDDLSCMIWQAVVGTSRLPLTSVEAPLPAYSFGKLHYVRQANAGDVAMTNLTFLAASFDQKALSLSERAKLVEFGLRQANLGDALGFLSRCGAHSLDLAIWKEMFNTVSLSPYTQFVPNAVAAYVCGAQEEERIEFLSHLLKQLHRHLTAYDLMTFHHRGANYPDASLLDTVLRAYIPQKLSSLGTFKGNHKSARKRQSALLLGCLLHRQYEGHFVPDAPTSPGENARVLPASHPRVPEEQLTQTTRRRKQLFADAPLKNLLTSEALEVLAQSVRDLEHLEKRVEMGLGLFIDRPLGYHKQIGEPDLTPLLAHEAFSPSIARRRWAELKKLSRELDLAIDENRLDALFARNDWPAGLPNSELADCPLPTAALADVRKVASDFVILRTMPRGLKILLDLFDWRPLLERHRLAFLADQHVRLCVQVPGNDQTFVLALYDSELQKRIELQPDTSGGYQRRAGVEWPRRGLRVLRVREDGNDSWKACDISIRAR